MPTEYRTITEIAGPLIFVEKTEWVGYGELVEVGLPDDTRKRGQVLDSSKDIVVVQVFEGTAGIDRQSTVKFLGETIKLNVSPHARPNPERGRRAHRRRPSDRARETGRDHGIRDQPLFAGASGRVHPDRDLHD